MTTSKKVIYLLCAGVAAVSLLKVAYAQNQPCTTTNVKSTLSVNIRKQTVRINNIISILCKYETKHFTVSGTNIYSQLVKNVHVTINGSTRKVRLGETDKVSIEKEIKKELSSGKNRINIYYEVGVEEKVAERFEIKVPVLFVNYKPSNSKTNLFESELSYDKKLRELNVFPTSYERFESENYYTLNFSLSVIPSHVRLSLEPQNKASVSTTRIVDIFLLFIIVIIFSLLLSYRYKN